MDATVKQSYKFPWLIPCRFDGLLLEHLLNFVVSKQIISLHLRIIKKILEFSYQQFSSIGRTGLLI